MGRDFIAGNYLDRIPNIATICPNVIRYNSVNKAMSKTTIRVVARVVALPEKVDEVKSILLALIEPTRQEKGCIAYELLQNQSDPTDFTFVEEWESQKLLNEHLNSAHLAQASSQLNGWIAAEPDIRVYQLLA
jgi:quinol monooxygenase YgiN